MSLSAAVRVYADGIGKFVLLCTAFALPLFVIPVEYIAIAQSKMFLILGVLAVILVVWSIERLAAGTIEIPTQSIFGAALLIPLAYAISALSAGWPTTAVVSGLAGQDTVVAVTLLFFVLVATALTVEHNARTVVTLLRALIWGGALLIAFQASRLFFPEILPLGSILGNETTTLFGGWHDFGIILGLVGILALALRDTASAGTSLGRALFTVVALAAPLFLVVVNLSDVWFVYAGTLATFCALTLLRERAEPLTVRVRVLALPLILIIIALGCGLWGTRVQEYLPEPVKVDALEVRPSWEGTFAAGRSVFDNATGLVFGSGPNSFARNWALAKPETVNTTVFWNLDFANGIGTVPTSLVTVGVVGAFAWLALIVAFLLNVQYALRRVTSGGVAKVLTGIVLASAYLFAFHIIYTPSFATSALLFLLLGIFVAFPLSESGRFITLPLGIQSAAGGLSLAGLAALLIVAGSASYVGASALISDVYVNRSIALYRQTGDVDQARAGIIEAVSVWGDNDRAHRAAVELGILKLSELSEGDPNDAAREALQTTLSATIEHGLSAVAINGTNYQNWLTLAGLYQELAGVGIEGAYEQAQSAYESARAENPTSPLPPFRAAQLEVIRGNADAALAHLGVALTLKPDFAPAYLLQSQIYLAEERLDEAAQAAWSAVQLVPQDPVGWYNLGLVLYANRAWSDASAAFAQAVTLRVDYSNALFMLALTFAQNGNTADALAALGRVDELNPGNTLVAAVVENVEAGREPFSGVTQQ